MRIKEKKISSLSGKQENSAHSYITERWQDSSAGSSKAATLLVWVYAKEPNAKNWKGFVQLNIWPSSWPVKASGCPQVLPFFKKGRNGKESWQKETDLFHCDLKAIKNNSEGDLSRHSRNYLQNVHSGILYLFQVKQNYFCLYAMFTDCC